MLMVFMVTGKTKFSIDIGRRPRILKYLSVLRFTDSDYPFGIFELLAIVLSVLRFTDSDYPFGITKGVIRIRKSKNRQHNGQKFEDTKGVIRIRNSKKNRHHNGQNNCLFISVLSLVIHLSMGSLVSHQSVYLRRLYVSI
jgi:hypothetical protein